jgi:hypothetical protein
MGAIMKIITVRLSLIAGLLLSSRGVSQAQSSSDGGVCSTTANVAQTACDHDVADSYWIAVGRCLNTSDSAKRESCLAEARDARTEDRNLCSEQFDARDDLCDALGEAPYDPPFERGDFVNPLEIGKSINPNRFFPLVPGSQWVYRSPSETVTVDVLGKVELIEGVPCTVVHDVVKHNGRTIEDTLDWFAQNIDGSVWYCGEQSEELEKGRVVDVGGSWRAGDEEARPGIVMQAMPHVGVTYRQEFALGEAEDAATIRSIRGSATVPAASCTRSCLVTREFTPLEPDAREDKYYAPDIGMILSVDRVNGERLELIRYRIP